MYLSEDLIAIQGILNGIERKTEEFAKIKFRGGNESKILDVVEGIKKFLCEKNYTGDQTFRQQLDDLIFFLALNTQFKKPLDLDEYSNLINVMPPLSVCLLANVAIGLDLCEFYGNVIERVPLEAGVELLDEMALCVKKAKPKIHLDTASVLLKASINKLKSVECLNKTEENVDKFSTAANAILQNLTGLSSNETENMKKSEIYQHMGFTIRKLFDLLLFCDITLPALEVTVKNILDTCSSVLQNVTVDVFCEWAEVNEGDTPLQLLVAEAAYLVIEKYQKFERAKSLISMLATIAKKPKTLKEKIAEADIPTIIVMVDKKDDDQTAWFKALLASNIVNNKEALNCLNTWYSLSTEDDVSRLLEMSRRTRNVEFNEIVVKCASVLTVKTLCAVTTRHFYAHKFEKPLVEDVSPQLTILFNKIDENADKEGFTKDLCLSMLRNAAATLKFAFVECLKNTFYLNHVKDALVNLRAVAALGNLAVKSLTDAVSEIKPCEQNITNYQSLVNLLLEINYVSSEVLLEMFLGPVNVEENLEELSCVLQVIFGSNIKILLTESTFNHVQKLIDIESKCRCPFTRHVSLKQEVARHAVDILLNKIETNPNSPTFDVTSDDQAYTRFYKTYLRPDSDTRMYPYYFAAAVGADHAKRVMESLRYAPALVTPEWLALFGQMREERGCDETVETICDTTILLSRVTGSQVDNGSAELNAGLRYCVQQFAIVMQDILERGCSVEEQAFITRQVCEVIRLLPESLKLDLGFPLINVIPYEGLKKLMEDMDFIADMLNIKCVPICEAIAKKMFNKND